jgi:hypothetical protein
MTSRSIWRKPAYQRLHVTSLRAGNAAPRWPKEEPMSKSKATNLLADPEI